MDNCRRTEGFRYCVLNWRNVYRLISTKYAAPTPRRERGKENWKKREYLLNEAFALMADYILPFLNEVMDSSLVEIYVLGSK